MAQQGEQAALPLATEKVGLKGYLAFFLTIIFFSGVFSGTEGWWRVFDFSVLNGSFGQIANGAASLIACCARSSGKPAAACIGRITRQRGAASSSCQDH